MKKCAHILLVLMFPSLLVAADIVPKDGWSNKFKSSGLFSWDFNDNVVGFDTGSTLGLGLELTDKLAWASGKHDFAINAGYQLAFQKSLALSIWQKTADEASLGLEYLYSINDWTGFVAKVVGKLHTLEGVDYRGTEYTYIVDGDVAGARRLDHLKLSSAGFPMAYEEFVGWFVRPVKEPYADLLIELGAQAVQIIADDQAFAETVDVAAKTIHLKKLVNAYEFGVALNLSLGGSIWDDNLNYEFVAGVFYSPFISPKEPVRATFVDKLTSKFGVLLSAKLYEALSLDWKFKAVRLPAMRPEFQLQSNLLLTLNWDLVS